MKTIDLHVHSNISDGSFTPSEVTELAVKAGLSAYALTDHDCTAGYKEAAGAAEKIIKETGISIEVIPAVEISAGYNNRDIHILGLYIDPDNENLNNALALTRERRFKRNQKMIKKFNENGINISHEELTFGNPNTIITRGHFSRLLIEKGYASNREECFEKYLNPDTKYFVQREYISIGETVTLIKKAGGIPFLAHPLLYKLNDSELESLVTDFKTCGGMGLEAIYSSNTAEDEIHLKNLAAEHNLLISGGTDFHGASKPDLRIGIGRGNMSIPYDILSEIKNSIQNK